MQKTVQTERPSTGSGALRKREGRDNGAHYDRTATGAPTKSLTREVADRLGLGCPVLERTRACFGQAPHASALVERRLVTNRPRRHKWATGYSKAVIRSGNTGVRLITEFNVLFALTTSKRLRQHNGSSSSINVHSCVGATVWWLSSRSWAVTEWKGSPKSWRPAWTRRSFPRL